MSPSALRRWLPVLAALLLALPAAAQRRRPTLNLIVVEEETGRPIPEARVVVSGAGSPAFTNAEGRVQMRNIPAGRRMMSVYRLGYRPEHTAVEFEGDDLSGTVVLRPQATEIAGVTVTSAGRSTALRNVGFYDREKRGHGAFLDRAAVEARNAVRTLDIFRQVRGFNVTYNSRGEPGLVTTRGYCPPLIFLDGIRMYTVDGRVDPSDFVHPSEVDAVEAYAGLGTIPPEYNATGSACGVVLIWTRSNR
ncbi:MAG: hypothetical protein AVDCRST_MAG68-1534 [uncultured Gemmatimonadetes bacterium]|uniref:TonB-dependent receptor plug domain-containing protein n=1 Tax=uncultured Gemmatimonadota bacterium TaxID=203437 RepID=A0A6J4KSK1_9BACT|nr:MAG: hypothetical protein AVDCRST_MAG68-1534 [uncultured Gemmatimonadota bacterium]